MIPFTCITQLAQGLPTRANRDRRSNWIPPKRSGETFGQLSAGTGVPRRAREDCFIFAYYNTIFMK